MSNTTLCVVLEIPLRDIWTAFLTPSRLETKTGRFGRWLAALTGHHYSIDFVKLDRSMTQQSSKRWYHFLIGGLSPADYFAWSQPVFAPVDGEVVAARDGWSDRQTIGLWSLLKLLTARPDVEADDLRPATGNYVIIKSEAAFVLLAHLREGTLKVSDGERIARGQLIGEVGNSGTSYAPHLHVQVMDDVNALTAHGMPFCFHRFECWNGSAWVMSEESLPGRLEPIRLPKT